MAVAWQATGTLLGSTGADITPVIPTHAINDILVLMASSRVITETLLTPSGWTLIAGPTNTGSWRTYAFYRRAVSASETNPLCDWSAAVGEKYGVVHNIRGVISAGNPFASLVLSADVVDPGFPTGIFVPQDNMFLGIMGIVSDNAASAVTIVAAGGDPAAFTSRSYTTITTGADAGQFFSDGIKLTSGVIAAFTSDFNAAPLAWAILTVVPNPPSTPSGWIGKGGWF